MPAACTYMMSNKSHTLYVGSTQNLQERVIQHKTNADRTTFTGRYRFTRLVWYEVVENIQTAQQRERQIKRWPRSRKVALIQALNPNWGDLSRGFTALLMVD